MYVDKIDLYDRRANQQNCTKGGGVQFVPKETRLLV